MERSLLAGISIAEDGALLRFGNADVELSFDLSTGNWLELRDRRGGDVLAGHGETIRPVQLTVGGTTSVTSGRAHLWSIVDAVAIGPGLQCRGWSSSETDGRVQLTLHTSEGPWCVDQRYTLAPGDPTIRRDLTIAYAGDQPCLLRWCELRLPWVSMGPPEDVSLEAPGYPFTPHQPLSGLPLGRWGRLASRPDADSPAWKPGLIALSNPAREVHLLTWSFSTTEPGIPSVDRGDHGVRVTHQLLVANRFSAGQRIEAGSSYVRLCRGTWLDALRGFQRWYAEADVTAVSDTPTWARRVHIYELHVGDKPFLHGDSYAPFQDVQQVIKRLPAIRALGFDTIEVMPRMPYPSYAVVDYHDVDTHYGPAEGMRALVRRAHKLGMRVLLDVVVHGVVDQEALAIAPHMRRLWSKAPERHPDRDEHPEWFCRTEDGRTARTYTWAFDLANPSLQRFIADVLDYYVREMDVDGFRMDAITWNYFPNWAEGLPYRASASHYGAVQLFEQARARLKARKPEVVLYSETVGPLFHRSFDLAYNYDEQWLFAGLLHVVSPRGYAMGGWNGNGEPITARDAARWLQERRLALPPGSIKVHHADSHDTHEWGGLGQFRKEAFGEAAARALFAFCCFIDGGVMVYAGAEAGSEAFYRHVLRLRRDVPALQGWCDYTAVESDDPRVFAPLWTGSGTWALPVINFADRPARVRLTLPIQAMGLAAKGRYRIGDRVQAGSLVGSEERFGRDLVSIELQLEPYGVALLAVEPV